ISGIQALTQKKDDDKIPTPESLSGKKVAVGLGTNYEQWLKENVPGAVVKTYDDDPTKFKDLMAVRTYVILVDRLAAL
ncbi:transporter substrate-binding domain-containing protein, partial [Pseudomonas sp. CCI2.4]|uniref:transporter substrate-binding domain-containing protein n=1 Tax=Pseudomonas sp. CCI2.4 TaxID=3048617 RepID=UPI002B239515